jgi:hypothetical protein
MPIITHVRRVVGAALAAAALSLTARAATAQKTGSSAAAKGDKITQILSSYRLSEPGLRMFYKAMENIGLAVSKDTTLANALDTDGSSDDDIAAMAARYDRVPALKRAVTTAGLTTTEFATFSLSYMQASMANSLLHAPAGTRITEVPKGTPKENVDFVQTHAALIESLQKAVQAIGQPGAPPPSDLR